MSKIRAAIFIGLTFVLVLMVAAFQFTPPGRPGGLTGVQEFLTSGMWVVPQGVSHVRVTMWGGGGGTLCHAPGGGGAYTDTVVPVTPGMAYTVTVGSGGANDGSNGGDSKFVASDGTVLAFAGGGQGGTAGGNGGQADSSAQISHPGEDEVNNILGGTAYNAYLAPDNEFAIFGNGSAGLTGKGGNSSVSCIPDTGGPPGNPGFVLLTY
jgi:hypothetical protein